MALIGITGGIGAGKSVVSRILRLKGFEVYDCDSEAKRLMDTNDELISCILERFGEECVLDGRELNRGEIAKRVFSSKEDLKWLNSQVHHLVREDIERWGGVEMKLKFVESAILHSSGLEDLCDQVWLVEAPEDIRLSRAMSRGGITEENLIRRMEAQQLEFSGLDSRKVRVINNYGSNSLLGQLDMLLDEIQV